MRVKVGETWYEVEPGQPIMVELNKTDRRNIIAMVPEDRRYAEFHPRDPRRRTEQQRIEWMNEGEGT